MVNADSDQRIQIRMTECLHLRHKTIESIASQPVCRGTG